MAIPCSDTLADVFKLPSDMPAMDDSHRGDVFRCAATESLTADFANSYATALHYSGPKLPSGFWTYRIAYRSLRNTPEGGGTPMEGDMAAVLLVPNQPRPGAPLVVLAHPTMGLGPKCAPSHSDLADTSIIDDYTSAVLPLAAYGYTVLVPDYAGYSYGQPPGYFNAEDEAHAILDGTRALKKVLPPSLASDKVVFVGHSQGGHAIIAAQHHAKSYGMAGTLIGITSWAPFWTSMAAWGGMTSPLAGFTSAKNGYLVLYSLMYFYSAGELRDGPGHGGDVFQAAKRDDAKAVVLSDSCFDLDGLAKVGAGPADIYDPTFIEQVGTTCAVLPLFAADCTMGDAPKWLARWKDDRPALDPMGPPMLIWYGGKDTNVSPGFAQCARDRFASDLAGTPNATTSVSYCFDADSTHNSLPRNNVDYVNQWIAARAGIGAEPAACAPFPSGQTCIVPPNDY